MLGFLIKTEGDAKDYYLELASKATDEGFRTIFEMLAKEEAKHVEWMKALAQNGGPLGMAVHSRPSFLV